MSHHEYCDCSICKKSEKNAAVVAGTFDKPEPPKSLDEMAIERAEQARGAIQYMTKYENYTEGYKEGHAARDEEIKERDLKIGRLVLKQADLEFQLSKSEARAMDLIAEVEELQKFIAEFAQLICGSRMAVDFLATREASPQIHQTNIDYFKKIDERLFELDNKIFEFGNYENGKFVFKKKQ